jgi:hypothetical protein
MFVGLRLFPGNTAHAPVADMEAGVVAAVAAAAAGKLTFKVRCHRSGKAAAHLHSEHVAKRVGGALQDRFGWTVDLKSGALEVVIYVSDDGWVAGLPVLRQPVVATGQLAVHGLHPTVAWALAKAGGISAGDVVRAPCVRVVPCSDYCVGSGFVISLKAARPGTWEAG